MPSPATALTHLPPQALAAFAEESARIASVRALMDAIGGSEATIKSHFHLNTARIVMVGQILQVQKQAIAYGKIGDWFVTHFGKERMKTMLRWAAVGEAVQQRCPELAQRTGQLLLAGESSAEELSAVGAEIAEQAGADGVGKLYAWAATVRNPPQKKRERPPAPLSAEKKAARELAEMAEHLGDLKQVLHLLGTQKAKATLGRMAEENPNGFAMLRSALINQWATFNDTLKGIRVR